ncbi:hypothetical protein BJQ94_17045 [Cryobacterium sp. SO2]|uniref:hypothetical protein n=1 Tax=Cryobacterium sp. SO2 TaxID=1897060 RepID=UPI00223E4175|nr:hypothetical protein [Cryobacterium sp. SO2]WEO77038.1 hypothetical protein BJQ94_17045 [Cryobacterium sp. SO2]
MRRSKSGWGTVAAGLLGVTLALTACTTASPTAAPTESAETVKTADWTTIEFAGIGPIDKRIEVPDGAASLRVQFTCLGGNFTLTTSSAMENDRSGGCQGVRTYLLPVQDGSLMQLSILLPADAHYALTGEFSTDVFTPDPLITDACAQLSEFMSLYLNADQGYQRGEVSAEDWRVQIDEATDIVTQLQDTATGLIALQVPALVEGISSPVVVPGYFLEQRSPTELDAAGTIVSDVCSNNGSGLAITSSYGG